MLEQSSNIALPAVCEHCGLLSQSEGPYTESQQFSVQQEPGDYLGSLDKVLVNSVTRLCSASPSNCQALVALKMPVAGAPGAFLSDGLVQGAYMPHRNTHTSG